MGAIIILNKKLDINKQVDTNQILVQTIVWNPLVQIRWQAFISMTNVRQKERKPGNDTHIKLGPKRKLQELRRLIFLSSVSFAENKKRRDIKLHP